MMLTIFTPTFNRKNLLERLFKSLERQTSQDFHWLIVDDGSTDDTKEMVAKLQAISNFPIEYIYQENEGKPFAFNKGVKNTTTPYFFCMDSDDWLKDNAVEIMLEHLEQVSNKKEAVGYVFQAATINGKLLTTKNFPQSPWYAGFFDMLYKEHIFGDTAIVYDTVVLKKNMFPKYGQEKFVPEALLLHRLEQIAPFCYINEIVLYKEYQEEGFSANMDVLYKGNPEGYYNYCLELLNFYKPGFKQMIRHIAAVGVFGKKIGKSQNEIRHELTKKRDKIWHILLLPAIFIYKL